MTDLATFQQRATDVLATFPADAKPVYAITVDNVTCGNDWWFPADENDPQVVHEFVESEWRGFGGEETKIAVVLADVSGLPDDPDTITDNVNGLVYDAEPEHVLLVRESADYVAALAEFTKED